MDAVVAVLRPKHESIASSKELLLTSYDILLVEMQALLAHDKGVQTFKQLPTTNILLDDEPGEALSSFLYRFTGGKNGGIRGKRTLFIPASGLESRGDHDSTNKSSLFCMSVDNKDVLDPVYVDTLPSKPAFHCLSEVLSTLRSNAVPYHKHTRVMLNRLHSWLVDTHSIPGAINLLFSSSSSDRLKQSVTSPAYVDNNDISASSDVSAEKSFANEALTKMLARDKCDVTKISPLYGLADLQFKCSVDKVVVNRYWGLGVPNYSQLTAVSQWPAFVTDTAKRSSRVQSRLDDYPLHSCSAQGNADGIRHYLQRGWSVTQRDADSFTPIHYAAKHGHIEAVAVLLSEGACSPNVTNDNLSTPLHLAAENGMVSVVELLLSHQEADVAVARQHISMAESLRLLLAAVWREIARWKDVEKRAITAQVTVEPATLDALDQICHEVSGLFCRVEQQLASVISILSKIKYDNDESLLKLEEVLNHLHRRWIAEHLQHAFVVDANVSDRVLKVSSRQSQSFNMSVRILGGTSFGLDRNPPFAQIEIFRERDIPDECTPVSGEFEVSNGAPRQFAVNKRTKAFSALFNSIHLKNFRRPPERSKNDELVTEMKYAFIFYTTVTAFGSPINLQVVSLPVILTSQTSQEIMAKGTLIWDAAFSEQDRKPFVYRDQVTWSEVAGLLNSLFIHHTGHGLPTEQLDYLATIALHGGHKDGLKTPVPDIDSHIITEKQVIRDKMPQRDFCFWKWIWASMNLLKTSVKQEWQDNLIYGFVSKEEAKRMLISRDCGTFLLRFSEADIEQSQKSEICGCLTLAFVEIDPNTDEKKLFHVKEYLTPKELNEKGLAPVLDAMEVIDYAQPMHSSKKRLLRTLWPGIPFEERFGKFIQKREKKDGDYVRGKHSIEIYLTNSNGPVCQQPALGSCPSATDAYAVLPAINGETYSNALIDFPPQQLVTEVQQCLESPMSESVTTATESSSDYQCAGQQLPQLSEFNDPQWIETMMQTSEDVLVAPTTLLFVDEDGDMIIH